MDPGYLPGPPSDKRLSPSLDVLVRLHHTPSSEPPERLLANPPSKIVSDTRPHRSTEQESGVGRGGTDPGSVGHSGDVLEAVVSSWGRGGEAWSGQVFPVRAFLRDPVLLT